MHKSNNSPCTEEEKHKYESYITDSIIWWLRGKSISEVISYIENDVDVADMLINSYPKPMLVFGQSFVGIRGLNYLSTLTEDQICKGIDRIMKARPDIGIICWGNKSWYVGVVRKVLDYFLGRTKQAGVQVGNC